MKTQKKIVRTVADVKKSGSLIILFRPFNITLFAKSSSVLRLLSFVAENLQNFEEIQMFTVQAPDMGMSTCQILTCQNIRKEYTNTSIMSISNVPYRVQSLKK